MTIWEEKLLGELVGLARATEGQYVAYSTKMDGTKREMVPNCFLCASPCGRTAALEWKTLEGEPLEVREVKFSIFQQLQKIGVSPRNNQASYLSDQRLGDELLRYSM